MSFWSQGDETFSLVKSIYLRIALFCRNEEKKAQGGKRDNEILIHRMRNGESVPYRVIDNPQKLSPVDWERVVAVFVMGPGE